MQDVKPGRSSAGTRNYPLNCWWVAATADELTNTPIGRWLLEIPLVLYRTQAGQAVALEDRCLHRWAPLSEGFLDGDILVCPYHGARFAPDGRCVRYPTQTDVPDAARVRSFAVVERGPFVWIWLGSDTKRAAADLPPDLEWTRDPAWTAIAGGYKMDANYLLIHENLLDLTHFNYLHRDSLKITNKVPPAYRVEGNRVLSQVELDLSDMTPEAAAAIAVALPVSRQIDIGAFMSPAHHTATATVFGGTTGNETLRITQIEHFMTPESPTKTHYWWRFGANTLMPPFAIDHLKAMIGTAFEEDRGMLSAIQNTITRDPRGREYMEFSFRGDMGGLQARRALERIMEDDHSVA